MERYYVNNTPQSNGDHEVHKEGCYWLGQANSKKDLGIHSTCHTAVAKAKLSYPKSNGCRTCSNECHTT
jgi:hypothetical protein